MKDQLRVLVWFAARPALYPELRRWIRRSLTSKRRDRKREQALATAWCEAIAVDARTALERITGRPPAFLFAERYASDIADGEARLRSAPVKMGLGAELDVLFHLAEWVEARAAIETGVGPGWSSLALLRSLGALGGRLVSTHMAYPGMPAVYEDYVGKAVPEELRPAWQIVRAPDREGLPQALALLPKIDICHYDSDKSVEGRMFSYPLLWAALRSGGVFISDDIEDNGAFVDFARHVGVKPVVIRAAATGGDKYVGVLVKP